MTIQGLKKAFKVMQVESGNNQTTLGNNLGLTKSNCSRLMNKNDFRLFGDVIKIADTMGYDVKIVFVDRNSGKVIDVE